MVHVKRDGKWQMALARDEEGPVATAHERLRPLAWLVGEWVDDGGSVVVHARANIGRTPAVLQPGAVPLDGCSVHAR